MRQALFFFYLGVCSTALAACGLPAGAGESAPSAGQTSASPVVQSETDTGSQGSTARFTIYIGSEGEFDEYSVAYYGELTETGLVPPAEVISAMAKITGWNLDLADQVYSGKGGITVTFADSSALLSGGGEASRGEIVQQDQLILDSVKRTLQCWAIDPELGDPDNVDIWFCGPDGGDLVLAGAEVTISGTEPYESFPAP